MGGSTGESMGGGGSAGSGLEYTAPLSDRALAERFEQRRRGVNDPARQVAAELQNISDALLEVLKQLRLSRTQR